MAAHAGYQATLDRLSDWRWRIDNLYHITDKNGQKLRFQMNWAQEALFNEMSFQNVILKARQLGFTTFIQIFMLDACLFNSNIRAGTIAHKLDDAKTIFRDKVKYPYDELPEAIKAARPVIKDSADELMFSNNSSIRVGTSLRSGTLQYLHVSEYGKLCAKYPDKAREVRTGALNTIQSGQVVFIESTAEGQEGHFFELSEAARAKERRGVPLTPLDFKFHFFRTTATSPSSRASTASTSAIARRLGHWRRRLHGDLVFPDHRRPVSHRRLLPEQRRGNALLSRRDGAHGA